MPQFTAIFVVERGTKNTIVYKEHQEKRVTEGEELKPLKIGTLYVQRKTIDHVFEGKVPKVLKVTVEGEAEKVEVDDEKKI